MIQVELGIGMDIQEQDAIPKATVMVILSQKRFMKIGNGKRDILSKQ